MIPNESCFHAKTYSLKQCMEPGGGVRIVPEYEVCKKIALAKNIPIRVVYDTIIKSL